MRRFSVAWKSVLDSEGLDEFHAKIFWPRKPDGERYAPFTGWSDERHASFVNGLLRVIETTKITPFACGVSPAEWPALEKHMLEVVSSTDVERYQKEAIRLPLHRIMYRVTGYCLPHKVMHYVFDSDKPVTQMAILTLFNSVKEGLREEKSTLYRNLGDLTFADSVCALPLQAADLLAYEAHRYAKAAKGDPNHPVRREFARALRRFRSREDFWFFDAARFTQLSRLLERTMETEIEAYVQQNPFPGDAELQGGIG